MNVFRQLTRLALLLAFTGVGYVFVVATGTALRLAGRSAIRWQVRVMHAWAVGCCRLIGIRIDLRGTPPTPPFMLVSNHLSYVDILVLAAVSPGVFVAKSEIGGWPLFGTLCRSVNTMFIDQKRLRDIARVNAELEALLAQRVGIITFPEGGIADGHTVHLFRSSLLQTAIDAKRPVHHVTLTYETPEGRPGAGEIVSWFEGKNLPGHLLRLLGTPWVRATLEFGERPIVGQDRKELARMLHEQVATRFVPLAGATPAPQIFSAAHRAPTIQ